MKIPSAVTNQGLLDKKPMVLEILENQVVLGSSREAAPIGYMCVV